MTGGRLPCRHEGGGQRTGAAPRSAGVSCSSAARSASAAAVMYVSSARASRPGNGDTKLPSASRVEAQACSSQKEAEAHKLCGDGRL